MKNIIITIVAFGAIILGFWLVSKNEKTSQQQIQNATQLKTENIKSENKTMDDLKIETVKEGTGAEAKSGDVVTVHYTGTLLDGTKFDSSVDRGKPFQFTLGAGQVIKGWDQGIVGMKIGEKRKLTIPADLAYGNYSPSPLIPANSTLVFEVELLAIQ